MSQSNTGNRCRSSKFCNAGAVAVALLVVVVLSLIIALPIFSVKHGHDHPGAHSVVVAAAKPNWSTVNRTNTLESYAHVGRVSDACHPLNGTRVKVNPPRHCEDATQSNGAAAGFRYLSLGLMESVAVLAWDMLIVG